MPEKRKAQMSTVITGRLNVTTELATIANIVRRREEFAGVIIGGVEITAPGWVVAYHDATIGFLPVAAWSTIAIEAAKRDGVLEDAIYAK